MILKCNGSQSTEKNLELDLAHFYPLQNMREVLCSKLLYLALKALAVNICNMYQSSFLFFFEHPTITLVNKNMVEILV